MTAQRGKDILLKIEGAAGAFITVAGLRARTISLNAKTVDATDSDSAGRWRELLAGAGVKSAAVSGQGIFRDAGGCMGSGFATSRTSGAGRRGRP